MEKRKLSDQEKKVNEIHSLALLMYKQQQDMMKDMDQLRGRVSAQEQKTQGAPKMLAPRFGLVNRPNVGAAFGPSTAVSFSIVCVCTACALFDVFIVASRSRSADRLQVRVVHTGHVVYILKVVISK